MLIESAENLIEDNLLDPDNSAPDHSNETQFSRQILELRAENKNLTLMCEIVETKSKYEEDISKFGSTLKLNAVKISGLECDIQAM
ncbi:hypothetical protein HZS_1368, partial [Henneguya salminicola]